MKRYRTLPGIWDGRALVIAQTPNESWDQTAKHLYEQNSKKIQTELLATYGPANFEVKLENFRATGYLNASIVTEHNQLLLSVRDAYVSGYYYPALVGACALAERILNDLTLKMRPHFTHENRRVHRNETFTNWELMIGALLQWEIITPDDEKMFLQLKELRSYSIHYDSTIEVDLKERSQRALKLVGDVIHSLFSVAIPEKYRIPGTAGAFYIRRSAESHPFIRAYFLPHCIYVGPRHRFTNLMVYPPLFEDEEYPENEISDEEFAARLNSK